MSRHHLDFLLLGAVGAGFLLPMIGIAGRLAGLGIFGFGLIYAAKLSLERKQRSNGFFFFIGLFTTGEIFFRDFAFTIVPVGGYLFVLYAVIGLAVLDIDAVIALTRNRRFTASYTMFLFFIIWNIVSLVFSLDPYRGRWFLSLDVSIAAVIALALAYGMNRRAQTGLIQGGLVGVMLLAGFTLSIAATSATFALGEARLGTGAVSPVQLASIYSLGILLFIVYLHDFHQLSLVSLCALGLTAILLYLTFSRGPTLALAGGCGIYVVYRGSLLRRFVLTIVLAIVAGYFVTQVAARAEATSLGRMPAATDESLFERRFVELNEADDRLPIWNAAIGIWLENPLAGVGVGSWASAFRTYVSNHPGPFHQISDAHNVVLQALAEGGLMAAVPLSISLLGFITAAVKARSAAGLAFLGWAIANGMLANWKLAAVGFAFGLASIYIWLQVYDGKNTFLTRLMFLQQHSDIRNQGLDQRT